MALATEHGLLAHVLAYCSAAGYDLPPLLIIDYYVAIKSSPFVLLFGPTGEGKTELARLFAQALVHPFAEQYAYVNLGVALDGSPFVDLQDRFGWLRFLEVLETASAPANAGRVFFLCLDDLRAADVETYFSLLVHDSAGEGYRLALPGCPPEHYPRVPPNLVLTGTLDQDQPTYSFSQAVLTRANFVYVRQPWFAANIRTVDRKPGTAPVGLQRLLLTHAVHSEEEATARLYELLGDAMEDTLHPPAELESILWQSGLMYDQTWRSAILRSVANSFDHEGRGLFNPHNRIANAAFAVVFALGRQMLLRLWGQEIFEQSLDGVLRQHLTQLPRSTLTSFPEMILSH